MTISEPRPIGPLLPGWQAPSLPGPDRIAGRYVHLERLDPARDSAALFTATADDPAIWDYMSHGPFPDEGGLRAALETLCRDTVPYAFLDPETGDAFGHAAFMRIDAPNGAVEIGHVVISPAAQRSRAASEALMVMIGWAFGAGYRRVEWKCNALNAASRRAARRYGFAFEGVFRRHMIVKGRNRDTAWFAMTDADWPALKDAYADWLDPRNFDESGRQHLGLSALTAPAVARAEGELAGL